MSDLDALLAGIVADPHDALRWLIVADWLIAADWLDDESDADRRWPGFWPGVPPGWPNWPPKPIAVVTHAPAPLPA